MKYKQSRASGRKRGGGKVLREEVLLLDGAFPEVFAGRERVTLEATHVLLL